MESPSVWVCEVTDGTFKNNKVEGNSKTAEECKKASGSFKITATAGDKVKISDVVVKGDDGNESKFVKSVMDKNTLKKAAK